MAQYIRMGVLGSWLFWMKVYSYANIQKFGVGKTFEWFWKKLCSPRLHLFDQKYSKNRNNVKYFLFQFLLESILTFNLFLWCNSEFSSAITPVFINHSNMLIWCSRIFLIIINAAYYFCANCDTFWEFFDEKNVQKNAIYSKSLSCHIWSIECVIHHSWVINLY